eukprot:jgi/Hompol1/5934/HPOL_000999-RA
MAFWQRFARDGNLLVTSFFIDTQHPSQEIIDDLLHCAVLRERFALADWLVDHRGALPTADLMDKIAKQGSYDAAVWLHGRVNGSYSHNALVSASWHSDLRLLKFLLYFGNLRMTVEGCTQASLPAIQYLYQLELDDIDWKEVAFVNWRTGVKAWLSEMIGIDPASTVVGTSPL